MKGKVILSAVSLILVVGVAIGVVVTVNKKGEDPTIQTQQRYIQVVCSNADEKKLCHETLSSINGTNPKAYIAAVVKATTDSVIKAMNMTDRLSVEHGKDNTIKMTVDDCKDLMQFALDSLQLSENLVRDNNIQSVHQQLPDIRNWLSSVIAFKQACTESFNDENDGQTKIKEQLQTESLDDVQKFTGIALDVVTDLTKILEQFGLKLDLKPASRRLLSDVEVDNEGYPSWFSAADRKLLGRLNRKNWRAQMRPNAVVAKDGSGQFKTVSAALAAYPKKFPGRYVIYVKAGVYAENILNPKNNINILMYGDGPGKTIITGNQHHPVQTFKTATFANQALGFIAKSMTFQNTAGYIGQQAVAFRNQGDQIAVVGCHILGYQDTLYYHAQRQFYRNCLISGTVDFIFGSGTAVIQHSVIVVRKPGPKQFNTITADGTDSKSMSTGIVIQDCNIVPEQALFPARFQVASYLGRPWKPYSRTVIMESTIGDFIRPEGWSQWDPSNTKEPLNTLYYAEYANTGPGANTARRIRWPGYRGVISRAEATQFTPGVFLKAGKDGPEAAVWLKGLRVPHYLGFKP